MKAVAVFAASRIGSPHAIAATVATVAVTMLVLDARGLYDTQPGSLQRPEVYWPAALVPIDLLWGVVLTAVSGFAGKIVHQSFAAPEK